MKHLITEYLLFQDTRSPDGTCQPDNNGLTTDLPENLHVIQNGTEKIFQSDKNEIEKKFDVEKSTKEENPQVGTTEIKNLPLGEPEKNKNSHIEKEAGMEKTFPGEIFEENKCDPSSLEDMISSLLFD